MLEFLLVFFVDLSMKITTSMFTIINRVLMSIRLSSDTFPSSLRRAISCSTRAISSRTDDILTLATHNQIAQSVYSASTISQSCKESCPARG